MKKVLFIDDEVAILKTYKRLLRNFNVEGFYAKNSDEAYAIYETQNIDLIISDYRLEQETGLDFLNDIRKEDKKVSMLIISGYAEEDFIESAMDTKVIQGYLLKPLSSLDFKKIIDDYIEHTNEVA